MVSDHNFKVYREAAEVLEKNNIPYVIGGGIAVMAFGRLRDTKDIDLYIEKSQTKNAMNALAREQFEIDEMIGVNWLAKAFKKGLTIDFILENVGGLLTSGETLRRGKRRLIGKYEFNIMSPEDLIIRKILAMRSERNDWFDCISVLSAVYDTFDWDYFVKLGSANVERVLSFLLYVQSDTEHIVPVPRSVICRLARML